MPASISFVKWLQSLPVYIKVFILICTDYLILNVAVCAAYAMRISAFEFPAADRLVLYLVAPVLSVGSAFLFNIYWSASRNYSNELERRILLSQVMAGALWIIVLLTFGTVGFARSVVLIYMLLSITLMILVRKLAATVFGTAERPARERMRIPALIYGAGREGQIVLEAIRRNRTYKPVAFMDTDYTLVGRMISGLKVYTPESLQDVMTRHQPQEVIVARSDLGRSSRRLLVDHFVSQGLLVKTLPNGGEFVDGEIKMSELRAIKVEDLLGRDPVPPDRQLMEKVIKDQVVMVTGAGGSIGSELVRQALVYAPRKLVLVDNSEFALFEIHRAVEASLASHKMTACSLVPLLADVCDKARIASIMQEHGVEIVFHAAAYKHVRMVQENSSAGIRNNVYGTIAVAQAALESKVKRFILISTDKAVRPSSTMGATKRVAEMAVQALAAESGRETIFAMVRFGNVLGSTGSVVPLFREQIANGGPVMVTHPEVTRYFMLIPEAAQLVIQAAAMAQGGEVFVLDMGEPVKILQLAKATVELAGLSLKDESNLDGDIEVKFIGLREGEKLFEELQIGSDISTTEHPRIMRSREFMLQQPELNQHLKKISSMIAGGDHRAAVETVLTLARMSS